MTGSMVSSVPIPDRQSLRKFGLLMAVIIALLFGLLLPWLFGRAYPKWPWVVSAAFVVPALVFPSALRPVYDAWMKFGAIAGHVNTRIILGLAFYLVVLPVGLIRRAFGGDAMKRKRDAGPTYRIPTAKRPRDHLEKPF